MLHHHRADHTTRHKPLNPVILALDARISYRGNRYLIDETLLRGAVLALVKREGDGSFPHCVV